MAWAGYTIATVAVAVLVACSLAAGRRLGSRSRLPMQWTPSGDVTWTAPRWIALCFTPVLAAFLLFGTAAMLDWAQPADPTEGLVVLAVMALAFAGAHAFHLRLLNRSPG